MTKKITLLLAIAAYQTITTINGQGLILGDRSAGATDSFSFNLLTTSGFNSTNEYFYVATSETLTGDARKYAVAGTTSNAQFDTVNSFVGLTPETVTLNGTANTTNPLYGTVITQLGMAGNQPVVTIGAGTTVYWFTSKLSSSTVTMDSVTDIKDANNAASAGVVLYADNSIGSVFTGDSHYLFAAVKPDGGDFGDANGGIALFKKSGTTLTQEKAVSGDDSNVKAVELAVDTAVLKMGATDLTSLIANAVDLYWDATLQRLYGAVRIDDAGADGGRAVFTAYLSNSSNNTKLNLVAIAPAAAFTGGVSTEIVGSPENGATPYIYRVRTMHTSTGLSYLMVQGNAEGKFSRKFYMIPLVDESADPANKEAWKTSSTHGTLAKVSSTPTTYYATSTKNNIEYMTGRGFQAPATAAGHLATTATVAAIVGGGDFPGTVSDVHIYKDTVFVASNAAAGGEPVGIFYSQALFDADGKIADWTAWQRVTYHQTGLVPNAFAFCPTKGDIFTLEGQDTVKRTAWGLNSNDVLLGGTAASSSVGLIEQINTLLPQNMSGVQGLFDFDNSNPAFAAGADNLSLMIATGYKKVVIIKTGAQSGAVLAATTGDFTIQQRTFTAGALDSNSVEGGAIHENTLIISVSGGDLDTLGPISCAAIVEDPSDAARGGYLVVGGVGGVALLRNSSTNAGWATAGLVKDLSTGFGTSLAFDKIGSYSNVRKLWTATTTASVQALYILTDTALYRIDAANLHATNPTAVTLATLANMGLSTSDSFADFVSSKCLGLLATSAGLYRTGNSKNISTATNSTDAGWQKVTLPESYTGITKLIPLSTTMLPYQFADGASGQVYYVASSVGYQNAAVNRLAITDASTSVNSSTVQTVSYPIIKNSAGTAVNSPLLLLGAYRGNFATNGASLLATSPAQIGITAQLNRLPLDTGNGRGFSYLLQKSIDLGLGAQDSAILGLTRSTATGSWLAYGDFGLRSLE